MYVNIPLTVSYFDYVTVCPHCPVFPKCCLHSTVQLLLLLWCTWSFICRCMCFWGWKDGKKKKQHKNTYTVACHYKQQPLTSRQTRTKRHKTQNESVYTFLYLSLIPDSKLLQSMCGTDNVALPHRWIIYPLPHCFGAISLKLNKTVCTCSTLRKPFPNKTQTL